jgi:hypothetical protein
MNDPVGGVFAALALIAAFIAMIVTFFMACASGNWGPFGDCWACILFFGIIGASLGGGKRRQPVHYCRRCGTRHALPLGPGCPR